MPNLSGSHVPDPHHETRDPEAVNRVREKMLSSLEKAAETAETGWHALELGLDLVHLRGRLANVQTALSRDDLDLEAVLREAQRSSLREPDRLRTAENRGSLVLAWTELLVEATEKVANDIRDSEVYALAAAGRTDEDREVVEGFTKATSERWRTEG
jgi:hypothetical protein